MNSGGSLRFRDRKAWAQFLLIMFAMLALTIWGISGCTIGRHDSNNLRPVPFYEWPNMDDKGWPINLFQPKKEKL